MPDCEFCGETGARRICKYCGGKFCSAECRTSHYIGYPRCGERDSIPPEVIAKAREELGFDAEDGKAGEELYGAPQLMRATPGHSEHVEPMTEYAFCETVTASGGTPWHIRPLTAAGKKLSGGADTPALCGRIVAWDLSVLICSDSLEMACPRCRVKYEALAL